MHIGGVKYNLAKIFLIVVCLSGFWVNASAQFKDEAFQQSYTEPNDSTFAVDTSGKMFSFSELFGGVAHKRDTRIGTLFAGSLVLPGLSQIYNREYWKLPIVYGGMGACAGLGGYYLHKYNISKKNYNSALELDPLTDVTVNKRANTTGTILIVGAGLFYWGALMDGMVNYKKPLNPHPGRATIYSILLPGLGQAYNGEYWKIPIYWGCLIGSAHFYYTNRMNYRRFRWIYNSASQPGYDGPVTQSSALYYRDIYRRYRDYSVLAFFAFYLLQVIDANVFAYMNDFDVSDDISLNIEPAVIGPDNAYAGQFSPVSSHTENSIGLRIGITF